MRAVQALQPKEPSDDVIQSGDRTDIAQVIANWVGCINKMMTGIRAASGMAKPWLQLKGLREKA